MTGVRASLRRYRTSLKLGLLGLAFAGVGCSAPEPEIGVTLTDFAFEPSKFNVERAKKTIIVLKNNGTVEHGLAVPKQSLASPRVAPGQTTRFELTLPPGTFAIACVVPEHEAGGMVGQIVSARR